MLRPRSRTLLTPVVLVLTFVLAGCSGSGGAADEQPSSAATTEAPRELTAGTCWTDEQLPQAMGEAEFEEWATQQAGDAPGADARIEVMRDDAAFTEEVDCAEPHALELYAAVQLPPALDRRVTSYADLLDHDSELHGQVRDAVNQRCLAGTPWGRAERRAEAPPVQLGPALSENGGFRLAWDPFPADLWAEGQRRFVCTFEQEQPGTVMFADLATSKLPVRARACLDTPGKPVRCDRPHQAEEIGEMVLNTAVASGAINAKRAERTGPDGPYIALSDAEYARLDRACQALFRSVSTGRPDVEAQVFPGAVDQWPNDDGVYVAGCFALKPFDPPPKFRGTVFDRR